MAVKKLLMSLVFAMVFSVMLMPISAFAAEKTVPENFVVPSYIYTEGDVVVDNPVGLVIYDKPEDPLSMTRTELSTTRAANVIYGPYTSLNLDDSKMQIIFSALRSGSNNVRVVYNGVNCFKFTSGGNTIYIASSALLKAISGTCASISSSLTSNANTGNTSWVYTNVYKSYQYSWNGNTIYRTSFARIGAQVYYDSSNQIYMSTKVFDSIAVDVYDTFIEEITYTSDMNIIPTAGVKISNTGTSNSMYFGGYEIQGLGEDTSTTSIGSMVNLGYKTAQTIGSISSLSVSTIYKLYNDVVSLTKSNSGPRKFYYTMPVSLSNPAANKYAYDCTTPSPFNIRLNDDYLTLKIGTIGTPVSSTQYAITSTFALR